MKKIIGGMLLIFFLMVVLVSAQDVEFTARQNQELNIFEPCNDPNNNGLACVGFECNITITNPNQVIIVLNKLMEKNESSYNYTLTSDQTSILGIYKDDVCCNNETAGGCRTFFHEITPSGYIQTTSQGLTSSIVLLIVFGLGVLFILIGFATTFHEDFWMLGLFLIGFGIVMIIYTLTLSVVYIRDLSYTAGTTGMQENVFARFMFIIRLFGVGFVLFMLFFVRHKLKQFKMKRGVDDGWDENEY